MAESSFRSITLEMHTMPDDTITHLGILLSDMSNQSSAADKWPLMGKRQLYQGDVRKDIAHLEWEFVKLYGR